MKYGGQIAFAPVPIGFSDGIPRGLSNKGQLLIRKKLCYIVGNVCMNHVMVDVTSVKEVQVGDEVIYVDNSNDNLISFDTHAKCLSTINTDLMSTINPTIPRKYI
jgi:alanine racemase